MTADTYNNLQDEDFPMLVKYTGMLYENKEFEVEGKWDFKPYEYHHIQIIAKKARLKIFGNIISAS